MDFPVTHINCPKNLFLKDLNIINFVGEAKTQDLQPYVISDLIIDLFKCTVMVTILFVALTFYGLLIDI